jgi:hypothetical protein
MPVRVLQADRTWFPTDYYTQASANGPTRSILLAGHDGAGHIRPEQIWRMESSSDWLKKAGGKQLLSSKVAEMEKRDR